jgi:hypothetical protein
VVREGLLHLEQEVCGEEGGGHAIGGHWLHHRSGRSMGGVYQSQRERERREGGWLRVCDREAEEQEGRANGNIR